MSDDLKKLDSILHPSPFIIGITGGIGSGKSVVSRILRLNGFSVYDCDTEAKRLMETDEEVIGALVNILGKDAYEFYPDTAHKPVLNRSFVAKRIFTDEELRCKVNEVVHKAVADDFLRFASEINGVVFCETAILATSRMDSLCSSIWIVTAPEEERIARVAIRNGMSEVEIKQRIDAQAEELSKLPESKIRKIYNGSGDMLLPQIYKDLNKEIICLEKF